MDQNERLFKDLTRTKSEIISTFTINFTMQMYQKIYHIYVVTRHSVKLAKCEIWYRLFVQWTKYMTSHTHYSTLLKKWGHVQNFYILTEIKDFPRTWGPKIKMKDFCRKWGLHKNSDHKCLYTKKIHSSHPDRLAMGCIGSADQISINLDQIYIEILQL